MEERIVSQPATQSGAWKKVKLREVCVSIADGDHQAPPKEDKGVPFVTISNIDSHNCMDFTTTMFVTEEYYDKLDNKRKPQKNDVLYSVVGSFGKPVFVKEDVKFVFQRHIAILRPNEEIVNPMFMYYTMLSKDFYHQADAVALGAAQRTISLTSLRNMEIALPPRSVQDSIATTLNRYDALISNYQRQIKLLEEAAQRLYKEWFVDLHFPGHENVKVTDGVPEGWEKKSITDLLEIKYGKDHKALKEGKYPVYGTGGVMRYVENILYSGESVLIPRKGSLNNIMLVDDSFWTIDTMFYSIPKIKDAAKIAYFYLKGLDMYNLNNGAAVPSMTVQILSTLKLLLPNAETRSMFETNVSRMYAYIRNLRHFISLLTESRDRLLPKLMSGEIEL